LVEESEPKILPSAFIIVICAFETTSVYVFLIVKLIVPFPIITLTDLLLSVGGV
jgi:hypothetical protein